METSLGLGRDSKALRIHAKEKFPIDSNTYLQVNIHSLSLFLFACVEVWNYQFIQLLNNLVSFSLWTHLLARSLRPNLLLEFMCLLWEFWSSQIWCCLFFVCGRTEILERDQQYQWRFFYSMWKYLDWPYFLSLSSVCVSGTWRARYKGWSSELS